MRAAVVVFPGSNADVEMIHTLRDVLGVPTDIVWHKDSSLPAGVDLVALPGGFSYGDYLRCGAICRASPIIAAIRQHAARGGLIIGVCNGFQILTEVGLLPGVLTRNAHLRFECRDVFVAPAAPGPFTTGLPGVLRLPIAHAEGRYQIAPEGLAELERTGGVAFRYCQAGGAPGGGNPNGSLSDIAGVYGGPSKNVMGLMPHPERRSDPVQGGTDGRLLFELAARSAAEASGARP
jgi:phosphoribosylformylglycinamidine synthase subunit PurQ / glutaminase